MKHHTGIACVLAVSIVFFAVSSLFGGEQDTGIIYGKDHSFMISSPPGWVLDNESAKKQGLLAVFYPLGSTWSSAPAVMYINAASKSGDATIDALIAGDFAREKEQSPGLKMRRGEPLPAADGTLARVVHFSGDKWGNFESVAYIEAATLYVMIILTSRNEAAYNDSKSAFATLVKSYRFRTMNVDTKEAK